MYLGLQVTLSLLSWSRGTSSISILDFLGFWWSGEFTTVEGPEFSDLRVLFELIGEAMKCDCAKVIDLERVLFCGEITT